MRIRTIAATAAIAALPLLAACGNSDTGQDAPKKPAKAEQADCGPNSQLSQADWIDQCEGKGDTKKEKAPKPMRLGTKQATVGGSGTGKLEVTPTTIVYTATATGETPDHDLFATVAVKDHNTGAVTASEAAMMESGGWKWVTKQGESIDAGEGNAAFNVVPTGFEGGGDIAPGTFDWSVAVFDLTKAQVKGGTLMYVDGNSDSYRWTAPDTDTGPQVDKLKTALAE